METVARSIEEIFTYERVEEVDSWPLMKTPVPMLTILLAYLLIVLKLGPQWMASKKPYNLQSMLIVYNFIALVGTVWLLFRIVGSYLLFYVLANACVNNFPKAAKLKVCEVAWMFLGLKIFELVDTIFFVLRKKQNHVSVLHVFHHGSMVFWTWMYLKYFPAVVALPSGTLNSMVHVVMYFYYLVAALGPQYQKYIWWKKYMTQIQILQFVVLLVYNTYLYLHDCGMPKIVIVIFSTHLTAFLLLFMNFYIQNYRKKGKQLHDK